MDHHQIDHQFRTSLSCLKHPSLPLETRGSLLALWQAEYVQDALSTLLGEPKERFRIEVMKTTGDIILDKPLSEVGGKGLFTKELEEALYDKRADIAVHSAKDMATVLPPGLHVSAYLPREDVRDAFISLTAETLEDLPQGARVGTASLRRQALVRRMRPDLTVEILRGNVQTRLSKIADGQFDATLLAYAGLKRLGIEEHARSILPLDTFPPAIGQGCVAIETRMEDTRINEIIAQLDVPQSRSALTLERAFLRELDGSCRTPIAGLATVDDQNVRFRGLIALPAGEEIHWVDASGHAVDAERLGRDAGRKVRASAGEAFMAKLHDANL